MKILANIQISDINIVVMADNQYLQISVSVKKIYNNYLDMCGHHFVQSRKGSETKVAATRRLQQGSICFNFLANVCILPLFVNIWMAIFQMTSQIGFVE